MEIINQFVLYTGEDGDINLKIFLEEDTLWLSQKNDGRTFPSRISYN